MPFTSMATHARRYVKRRFVESHVWRRRSVIGQYSRDVRRRGASRGLPGCCWKALWRRAGVRRRRAAHTHEEPEGEETGAGRELRRMSGEPRRVHGAASAWSSPSRRAPGHAAGSRGPLGGFSWETVGAPAFPSLPLAGPRRVSAAGSSTRARGTDGAGGQGCELGRGPGGPAGSAGGGGRIRAPAVLGTGAHRSRAGGSSASLRTAGGRGRGWYPSLRSLPFPGIV